MILPIIAFDEAGNTGQNLLDISQPIFALGSVSFNNNELNELYNIFDVNSTELHFKKLRKYSKSQKQLLAFCDHKLITFSKVKFSISDKRYAVFAQMVDLLIEPVLHKEGIDIYKYGMNIGYTNTLYAMAENVWNKEIVQMVLKGFVRLVKTKSPQSAIDFYSSVELLNNSISDKDQALLTPIIASWEVISKILNTLFKYSIDLTYPSFSILCDWWYRELNQKFDILHDESKQIDYWKEMIEFTTNSSFMEEKEVGYDNRKMIYPLKINKLELVDSKLSKAVQLADLVASSVTYALKELKEQKKNSFVEELIKTRLFQIKHHAIIPTKAVTPSGLGMEKGEGENPLDYLADMFNKSDSEIQKIFKKM
ncbi:MAG: DUF3800 domain-containing protein [Aureispira sp.]